MSIKTRIYFIVSILFIATVSILMTVRHIEITRSIDQASEILKKDIIHYDMQRRQAIIKYLRRNVEVLQERFNLIFDQIEGNDWMQRRYYPSKFNMETNNWGSSAVLMLTYPWLDFVQVLIEDQVKAMITARPPYLSHFVRIKIDEDLHLIIKLGSASQEEVFIGVPVWNKSIMGENTQEVITVLLNLQVHKRDFLLFTLEQILDIDVDELNPKDLSVYSNPVEPDITPEATEAYTQFVKDTLDSIKKVQQAIKSKPHLYETIKDPQKRGIWIQEEIDKARKVTQEHFADWSYLHTWNERYEENRLIWELAEVIASGIWNFNPFYKDSPKGIVSFDETGKLTTSPVAYKGGGVLSYRVFHDRPFHLFHACTPTDQGYCINRKVQLNLDPNTNAIYLGSSMVFKRYDPSLQRELSGSLTIGTTLDEIIELFALSTSDTVFFITKSGNFIIFGPDGKKRSTASWEGIDLKSMLQNGKGNIQDIEGNEYLFIHLTQITEDDGHIFVVELKEDILTIIKTITFNTAKLLGKLAWERVVVSLIGLIIALLILHQVLKRLTKPLMDLAKMTKPIGEHKFSEVTFSPKLLEKRDEIGLLYRGFDQMVEELKKGEEVSAILHKVVSKEIAEKILKEGVKLKGENRMVAVLFSDIRNFTHITEHMEPEKVLEMLNDLLSILSRIVDEHRGVIDKYIGDEIMALFGAPVDLKNPQEHAVSCAIDMMHAVEVWNEQRKARGLIELQIGIGIHAGQVFAGNVGGENHLSYTILGHTVNLASRVCDYAKAKEILITEEVLHSEGVEEMVRTDAIPSVSLEGISKLTTLYRIKK